jgi:hypothetical protein
MDEMYRMLGREREADLEREAVKWRRAAELRDRRGTRAPAEAVQRPKPGRFVPSPVAVLFTRLANAFSNAAPM